MFVLVNLQLISKSHLTWHQIVYPVVTAQVKALFTFPKLFLIRLELEYQISLVAKIKNKRTGHRLIDSYVVCRPCSLQILQSAGHF